MYQISSNLMSRKKNLLLSIFLIPTILAGAIIWGYHNYLYDLDASCPTVIIAGNTIPVEIDIASNAGAVVHVELKGEYDWGDWIYDSETMNVQSGISNITATLDVPVKLLVEPTCDFYVYVYVTFPGEIWGIDVWGIRCDTRLNAPETLSQGEVTEIFSHMKYLVSTSNDLPPGIQKNLLSALDDIALEYEIDYTPEKAVKLSQVLDLLVDLKCLTGGLPHSYHDGIHFIVENFSDYIED